MWAWGDPCPRTYRWARKRVQLLPRHCEMWWGCIAKSVTTRLSFLFVFWDSVSLCHRLSYYGFCRPGWPWIQRSTYLCPLSAGLKVCAPPLSVCSCLLMFVCTYTGRFIVNYWGRFFTWSCRKISNMVLMKA